ncbi:hypothetical protein BJ912DRAFT_970919 [Pholiota molesta]|nr:hypothetical protein BJ912DRAFT_970919 [Pholiota molesta]
MFESFREVGCFGVCARTEALQPAISRASRAMFFVSSLAVGHGYHALFLGFLHAHLRPSSPCRVAGFGAADGGMAFVILRRFRGGVASDAVWCGDVFSWCAAGFGHVASVPFLPSLKPPFHFFSSTVEAWFRRLLTICSIILWCRLHSDSEIYRIGTRLRPSIRRRRHLMDTEAMKTIRAVMRMGRTTMIDKAMCTRLLD